MAVRTTYFVTVLTDDAYTTADYAVTAGQLVNAIQYACGTDEAIAAITKSKAPIESCSVEVEVKQHDESQVAEHTCQVVARAIVELRGEAKVDLLKPKMHAALREKLSFNVKLQKRAVPADQMDQMVDAPEDSGS